VWGALPTITPYLEGSKLTTSSSRSEAVTLANLSLVMHSINVTTNDLSTHEPDCCSLEESVNASTPELCAGAPVCAQLLG
jgi:hypothetical protein